MTRMNQNRVEFETIACPICSESRFREHLKAADPTGTVPGEFHLVQCIGCGLVYLNPRPTIATIGACYPDTYDAHRSPETDRRRRLKRIDRLVLSHWYDWPFQSTGPSRRAWVKPLLRPLHDRFRRRPKNFRVFPFEGGGRLLDVGCGSGAYLQRMREGGWTVTGAEPDREAAERARRLRGLDVHAGDVLDAPLEPGSFDVVTLWHVLEHVWNPCEVIARIRDLLAPAGRLVVMVPAIDGHAAQKLGPFWYHLDAPRHLLHFTRARLSTFVEQQGFRIEALLDDPRGSAWRLSYALASSALRAEPWFRDLATHKRRRHAFDAELARRGESAIVLIHARKC